MIKAYIEDLDLIAIETDEPIAQIELKNYQLTFKYNKDGKHVYQTNLELELDQDLFVIINQESIRLNIGIVTLSKRFDQKYRYDGPLGYVYDKDQTSFYLFSPVAKSVEVVIGEQSFPMIYEQPIWKAHVKGDFEGQSYVYRIRLEDDFKLVRDPYANAATTKGNIIIDWSKTYQMKEPQIAIKDYVDAVIYEGHVRDMTLGLDVKYPGTFEGLIEKNNVLNQSVIEYVKDLGMTHLQLLPIYDFELVDEWDKGKAYNWGYNPSQYFVLEGWYSKNPDDPYDRINALKKVIDQAHAIGLGINMDVVYNHVFDHKTFPYDDIVPKYFYRHDINHQMTNGSFCGNEVESRRYMVRRLIVDSLKHFAKVFQMDGFRFDLMGLLDVDTMCVIEKELRLINSNIMLYGEGWHMDSVLEDGLRASMKNHSKISSYAHFNDDFRNTLKGKLNTNEIGYAFGAKADKHVAHLVIGSPHMFDKPGQSMNYVECHDNLTFFDRSMLNYKRFDENFYIYQDFVNHVIAISQGIPFYHAGQEFYRSKKGVENSYESSDDINRIDWKPNGLHIDQLKKILHLRKTFDLYSLNTYDQDHVKIEVQNDLIIYTLTDEHITLTHYIYNQFKEILIPIYDQKVIFASQAYKTVEAHMSISLPGVYITKTAK